MTAHAGAMLSKHAANAAAAVRVDDDCQSSILGMPHHTGVFFPSSAEIHACHMVLFPWITSKGSGIKDLVLY